jgi:hypothetical protein
MSVRRGLRAGAAFTVTILLLAGCGGSNSSKAQVATASLTTSTVTTSHAPIPLGKDKIKRITGKPVPAQGITGAPNDEVNATGAKKVDPCTLVTRAEAQAIVGKQLRAPVEAPQGPTCIYRPTGGRSFITLAVESLAFSKVLPQSQLRDRISLTIAGHTAYCGNAGGQQLIVPLSNNRFLTVSAPCPIAAEFAKKALSRYA